MLEDEMVLFDCIKFRYHKMQCSGEKENGTSTL